MMGANKGYDLGDYNPNTFSGRVQLGERQEKCEH